MPFFIGKPNTLIPTDTTDYGPDIAELKSNDFQQDVRIGIVEGTTQDSQTRLQVIENSVNSKANLVNGKVPFHELPDISSGRKVAVSSSLERLALPLHNDLTIAYEEDTGDAYILDAGANPSVVENWSRLGSAQGIGVSVFNGRTGNISPEVGDYLTSQITETAQKYFLTPSKEALYEKISNRGVANGYAPLGSAAKVPMGYILSNVAGGIPVLGPNARLSNDLLPPHLPQSKRVWRDVKSIRNVGEWITNTSGNEMDVHVRASLSTTANRFISLQIRENETSPIFIFNSAVINPMTTGNGYGDSNTVTVPAGWQYTLATNGGSTNALTERWYELS